jgi:hypothetical protein
MMATTTAPFNTEEPISARGMATFRAIADRLALGSPPLIIENHIAQRQTPRGVFSTLKAHDSTLDGIDFYAEDPNGLAERFETVMDGLGNRLLVSMKEEPDHWALKKSFEKTPGTGWREPWRAPTYNARSSSLKQPGMSNNMFRMRFGNAGTPLRFTALHCAVDKILGSCNIHIDESGFVLALPRGVSLTADAYDHLMNELLLKTDFRDWLVGKISNKAAARIVRDAIRRLSFQFPNATNGYAGLEKKINSVRRPNNLGNVLRTTVKLAAPTGLTFDLYDKDDFKVQATGTMHGGDKTITLTLGGRF